MYVYTEVGFLTRVAIAVLCLWQRSTTASSSKGKFSYEFLDSENTILKLRCDGDCSTDNNVLIIIIYNVTSMATMSTVFPGKNPNVFEPSVPDVSFFVAGGKSDVDKVKSCPLELVISKCDLLPRLQFGCNVSYSNDKGDVTIISTSLSVERKASQNGSHNVSTTTLIILIVVIIVVFLLCVFFLSMWLRGCCRYKDRMIYRTSSHGEISGSQVFPVDSASVFSFQRSLSQVNDKKEPEYKLPPSNGSVRRINSTGSRVRYPPLPNVPPPKMYWKETHSSQAHGTPIKVSYTYARPQDAIDPDFSEDGDVTSSNSGAQPMYFHTNKSTDNQQVPSFYSSVPVGSVDV